jgi:uridine kinase
MKINAISGAMGAGKTTAATNMFKILKENNKSATLFNCDAYLLDRDKRNGTGYRQINYHFEQLQADLDSLVAGNTIYQHLYSHETGCTNHWQSLFYLFRIRTI